VHQIVWIFLDHQNLVLKQMLSRRYSEPSHTIEKSQFDNQREKKIIITVTQGSWFKYTFTSFKFTFIKFQCLEVLLKEPDNPKTQKMLINMSITFIGDN
jgi:hypothetical protein